MDYTFPCPGCRFQMPYMAKFCPSCGNPWGAEYGVGVDHECGHCEASVPASSRFCPHCGNDVKEEAESRLAHMITTYMLVANAQGTSGSTLKTQLDQITADVRSMLPRAETVEDVQRITIILMFRHGEVFNKIGELLEGEQ